MNFISFEMKVDKKKNSSKKEINENNFFFKKKKKYYDSLCLICEKFFNTNNLK